MLETYYLMILCRKEVKWEEMLEIMGRDNRKINLPWAFYVIILDGSERSLKERSFVSERIKND